jgi:hypothetical protein
MTERGLAARGIDTTKPNVARIYYYLLGGKDNISQVVPAVPYSGHTRVMQARQAYDSKTASFVVRDLARTCLCAYVCFVGRGS